MCVTTTPSGGGHHALQNGVQIGRDATVEVAQQHLGIGGIGPGAKHHAPSGPKGRTPLFLSRTNDLSAISRASGRCSGDCTTRARNSRIGVFGRRIELANLKANFENASDGAINVGFGNQAALDSLAGIGICRQTEFHVATVP